MSAESPSLRERLAANDLAYVLVTLAGVYALYLAAGLALGFEVRGLLNSLGVVTFYVAVFAMLALALNLHWGYTGLFNIGVVGFMAVGIYTMAIVSKPVAGAGGSAAQVGGLGLPLWVGIIAGMVVAALLGLVVALPALRLRADYLAIVTIAMSEIVRFTLLSSTFQTFTLFGREVGLGGGSGLILDFEDPLGALIGALGLGGPYDGLVAFVGGYVTRNPRPVVDQFVYSLLLLLFVAGFYWLLKRTGESPFGRVLKAIREDEQVASALGKDTGRFKTKSFMLGCALMGLVGVVWYMGQGAITPNTFRPRLTFFVWIALIIGGAGSNTGSVLGGAVFAAILFQGPLYFKNLVDRVVSVSDAPGSFGPAVAPLIGSGDPVPFLLYTVDSVRQLQLVLMGVVLIVLMHRRPEGLLGHRTETAASIPLVRPPAGEGDEPDSPAAAADGGATDE
ncbi:MAG: branched-chain amino acid ABC transporter permease [Haloferacaceae archaeon]